MISYFELDQETKKALLNDAASRIGRRAEVLEKDIWVCWALDVLFDESNTTRMAFKGGTSLSKAYKLIERFSEDVDITIDYRDLDPQELRLEEPLSGTQRKKLSENLRSRSADHVRGVIEPKIQSAASTVDATSALSEDGENLRVFYPSVLGSSPDYLKEEVLLEFGGRNITEPCTMFDIEPDIAGLFDTVEFPKARPHVLNVERTFWEKLTAIHFECNRKEFRTGTNRLSRHWYDVYQLLKSDIGTQALGNVEVLKSVVEHKNAFYYSGRADYEACLRGEFHLFPSDLTPLESDYEAMSKSGMFYGEHPSFGEIHEALERLGADLRERFS